MDRKEEIKGLLREWLDETYVELNPYFIENMIEIRKDMPNEIEIPIVSMLDYKKTIIKELEKDYSNIGECNFKFTDEELEKNRFMTGSQADRKITKVLSELIKESRYSDDQRIDYFHKLRNPNVEYKIYSSIEEIATRYKEVETCLSPGGSNQSNIFRHLYSPYAYLIGDREGNSRMLAYIDFKNKYVFLHRVYGAYDLMLEISAVKYFVDNDFLFVRSLHRHFYGVGMFNYIDASQTEGQRYIEYFGGKFKAEENEEETVHLFKKPENAKILDRYGNISDEFDAFKDERLRYKELTINATLNDSLGIRNSNEYCCSNCGEIVDSDDYDFDYECCSACSNTNNNYCSECDCSHIPDYDFNFSMEICNECVERKHNICSECDKDEIEREDFNFAYRMCNDCAEKHIEELENMTENESEDITEVE